MVSSENSPPLQLLADLLLYYFLSTLIIVLSYVVYLPLFLKSIHLISPRLRSSVPTRWLLALILILFIPTTVHLVSGTFITFVLLNLAHVGQEDDSIQDKLKMVWQSVQTVSVALYYTGRINILLIDVIVVWRAYALQPHRRWLHTLLLTLLTFGLILTAILMIITPDPGPHPLSDSVQSRLKVARDVIALSVTILGAACIVWTAWYGYMIHVIYAYLDYLTYTQIVVMGLDLEMIHGPHDPNSIASPEDITSMLLTEITIFASAIHLCLVTVLVSDESHNTRYPAESPESKLSTFAVVPPISSMSTV
ncbi:hypothetical protein DL96DRAFT_1713334 [Flagelloscypha sp. PMI_526]|nr:hypothetical protein DL96DRAFT_1713334 [Flagelloscypha sp. PMI_526]